MMQRGSCSRAVVAAAFVVLTLALPSSAGAEETRFDIQTFRPFGAPQDLVMVGQSRPLSHLSFAAGLYVSFAWNPLTLLKADSHQSVTSLISGRLQFDVHASLGLFNYVELGAVMPLLSMQWGGNQEAIGSEGTVSAATLGDLRMFLKFAPPWMRRKLAQGKGFGSALVLTVAFPTGSVEDFTSDGKFTFSPALIIDYRFSNAWLIAINLGAWLNRAEGEFAGVRVGDMLTASAATEVPLLRGRGLFAIGEVFANPIIPTLIHGPAKVPAEWLIGLRWYSSNGFTFTFGGGGGFGCNLDTASIRLFAQVVFLPWKMRERVAIQDFKQPPADRDEDGIVNDKDKCPDKAGPVENHGCPDGDRDGDKIPDRVDACPDDPMRPGGKDGCPPAHVEDDHIVLLDQVHFATDQDIILPESFYLLEDVALVLRQTPGILQLLIEGHTDSRASAKYNMDLSSRRANSVMRYLVQQAGIDQSRLRAEGFGLTKPIAANNTEAGMALNRRVVFTIEKNGMAPNKPIVGAPSGPANILPMKPSTLPDKGVLRPAEKEGAVLQPAKKEGAVLHKPSTLPSTGPIPTTKVLPSGTQLPTNRGVLPRANEYNTGPAQKPE